MQKQDDQVQIMLEWIDNIPLSRPKKNFSRDFSDAILAAEVVKHFFPKLVEMHNYPSTSSASQKLLNWKMFSAKVLKKLGIKIPDQTIEGAASAYPGFAEQAMIIIMQKIVNLSNTSRPIVLNDEIPEVLNNVPEYEQTIQMLLTKIEKLEQLLVLKDKKIEQIQGRR
eukprot:NODE_379_length_9676_cov_0.362222.p4 type:complete len:168 gc:universal NODE_379_length_9676_cov_0.362222:8752-8249(-)